MSEQILLLNPRHRVKRRRNRHRRRARRSNRRRRMPAALRRYWAGRRSNPRRRRRNRRYAHARRHSRRANRRRYYAHTRRHNRRRRSYSRSRRHNRRGFSLGGAGGLKGAMRDYIGPAAIGAIGALPLDLAWAYVQPKLPAQLQTGWFGLFAKSAGIIVLAGLAGKFIPRYRRQIHIAGLASITASAVIAVRGAAQAYLPAGAPPLSGYIDYQSYALPGARGMHGLGGYMPRTLGSLEDMYSPAAVIQPPGTPVPRQFGSYIAVQPHVGGGGGVMGYDWAHDGM